MRLLIVSNMSHYHTAQGELVGWGPTVNEIDSLAGIFEEVRHIGCLHPGPAPDSALPYRSAKMQFIPVPPAGGGKLVDKLGILVLFPLYVRTILRELPAADIIHIRAPANISLLAMVLLAFVKHPPLRWIKYAGNWWPIDREPWSYALQRWWLRQDFSRARVTVNGDWPGQPVHIRSFFNPCLMDAERRVAAIHAEKKRLGTPLRLIFVGRVERAKGVDIALQVLAALVRQGGDVRLDILGDGIERSTYEHLAFELGVCHAAIFHGWIPRTEISEYYRDAHFILLPSVTEGWPKVLSEAMAYGVVPVASDVSSIGQYLRRFGVGCAVSPVEAGGFLEAIKSYVLDPPRWKVESERSVASAALFTYDAYLDAVRTLLQLS